MVEVLTGTFTVKAGHAQMLKGGVIMDVVNVEQAKIAEEAGAVAVRHRDGEDLGAIPLDDFLARLGEESQIPNRSAT